MTTIESVKEARAKYEAVLESAKEDLSKAITEAKQKVTELEKEYASLYGKTPKAQGGKTRIRRSKQQIEEDNKAKALEAKNNPPKVNLIKGKDKKK